MSLATASAAFLEGYRLARVHQEAQCAAGLLPALLDLGHQCTPFAFEGAGMALRVQDERQPEADRVAEMFDFVSPEWHPFLMLGVGCALARIGRPAPDHPVALDGYGFQLGLTGGASTSRLATTGPRMERGLGRAMWFTTGGDAPACAALLRRGLHPEERWRGVGTACAFAGDPKGHAPELARLGRGFESDLRIGAGEALRLWRSLGVEPPSRVHEVVEAFGSKG